MAEGLHELIQGLQGMGHFEAAVRRYSLVRITLWLHKSSFMLQTMRKYYS